MSLRPLPFGQMASGEKTIEARLYDEKRQLVQLGDKILFTNTDTNETLESYVTGLLRYASFHDMFHHQDPRLFGFNQSGTDQAVEMMRHYYSQADEVAYGVLGIQVELAGR